MIRHQLLSLLLTSGLCFAAPFSSFKNFPVVGLRSSPASPLPLLALEEEQEVPSEEAARRLEELEEEVPRQARQADINSYSDSNLDDTFIEEALFLTPEDREEREYSPRFEDWAEEEGEGGQGEGEVVRLERDGLGGHHGAHHGAHEEDHAAPMPVRRRSRKGGRRQQQQVPARRQEARPEESFRGQEQDEREGRQTGAVGFAAGGRDGGVGVLSSPPNAAGDYNFNFSNDDGSSRQETAGPAGVSGSYSFFTPEGEKVDIQYIADETGFHASGSHVPVAPPMPPAIRRMLDHLAKVNGHAKLY